MKRWTAADFARWRGRMGYDHDEAAAALWLSSRAIYRYEDGSRKVSGPVQRLCQVLQTLAGIMDA